MAAGAEVDVLINWDDVEERTGPANELDFEFELVVSDEEDEVDDPEGSSSTHFQSQRLPPPLGMTGCGRAFGWQSFVREPVRSGHAAGFDGGHGRGTRCRLGLVGGVRTGLVSWQAARELGKDIVSGGSTTVGLDLNATESGELNATASGEGAQAADDAVDLNATTTGEGAEAAAHAIDLNATASDEGAEAAAHAVDQNAPTSGEGAEAAAHGGELNATAHSAKRIIIQRRQYKDHEKQAIYAMLLERTSLGILKHGVTKEVARLCGVPKRTVQQVWRNGKVAGGMHRVISKKPKNCGRKRIAFNSDMIKGVDLKKRTTLQDLANELNMSTTTLHKRLKEGRLRRHTNSIKGTLTEENKKGRVRFCMSMLDLQSNPQEPKFYGMYNIIHIDEKWFYRTRKVLKVYLATDEEDPKRTTQNKNYIERVMFLSAVARPRYDDEGNMAFDGKIGMWPFTFAEEAKRGSKNREAGTLVTKVVPSVTKAISREYLLEKVLPAIKEKWPPSERGWPIYIQQDNAKTHIAVDDSAFCAAAKADGWNIELMCQPPNSPDLNILDLGFFAALQSIFQKLFPGSLDDIVAKVLQAYNAYPPERSNRIFLTLQSCMREVLKLKGSQQYKVPHMRKKALARLGILPISLDCEKLIVDEATEFLGA